MSSESQIQLKTSNILRVPFNSYDVFTFVVNGERFKTTRLIADLLSSKICQIHQTDPCIDEFIINTQSRGNFSSILNLINFDKKTIQENEAPFFSEIIEKLGPNSIDISLSNQAQEITIDNVFNLIKKHTLFSQIYSELIKKDIDFISEHFYELCEQHFDDINQLDINIITSIISNEKLQINDEDQLVLFINKLYTNENKYSLLYEFVYFENVSEDIMNKFIDIFDINDLTNETWKSISIRLKSEIKNTKKSEKTNRYKQEGINLSHEQKGINLSYEQDKEFNGIFKYLLSDGNIDEKLNITSSSILSDSYIPKNAILCNDHNKLFYSGNQKNNWLRIDFKEHKVILNNYTIKSHNTPRTMKNWVIEGSNDNSNWTILDKRTNCEDVKGGNQVHTFSMSEQIKESYRYIQIRQTGKNWNNDNYLTIDSFEIYGLYI